MKMTDRTKAIITSILIVILILLAIWFYPRASGYNRGNLIDLTETAMDIGVKQYKESIIKWQEKNDTIKEINFLEVDLIYSTKKNKLILDLRKN